MQEENINNNNINILDNTMPEATAKPGMSRYLKLGFLILIFLFLIASAIYYFTTQKNNVATDNGVSFPDINTGSLLANELYQNKNNQNVDSEEGDENYNSGLINIWPREISGYAINSKITGTTTSSFVFFTDTQTGNVYKSETTDFKPIRLTNTALVNIKKSSFSKNSDYILNIQKNGSAYDLIGSRLVDTEIDAAFSTGKIDINVYDIFSSKDENIYYYLKKISGNYTLYSYSPTVGKINKISDINLFDIFISGEDKNNVYLLSKSTRDLNQLLISINKKTGSKKYTKTSPNSKISFGEKLITSEGNTIFSSDISSSKNLINTNIISFADKCADIKKLYIICGEDTVNGGEDFNIDAWNRGEITTNDNLRVVKLNTKEDVNIPISIIAGEPLDVSEVKHDANYFVFKNKIDGTLWSYNIDGF